MMPPRNLLLLLVFLAFLSAATAQDQEPVPKVGAVECGPLFRKPGFASIANFAEAVQAGKAPWGKLLTPDPSPESGSTEAVGAIMPDSVTIMHATEDSAIVFARQKQGRTAPFCVVIFLLEKKGTRFHVTDFIRRSEGYESYADVSQPQILHLQPKDAVHFHFTVYLGGRKWGFDTDEFYMVRSGRFRSTLTLKNVGAYLSPADPYREFSQSADVGVSDGNPRVVIHRSWGIEGGRDRRQEFTVAFQWDAQAERFVSENADRISLREPKLWTGAGLPKPPGD